MSNFSEFLMSINDDDKRARLVSILNFVKETFPQLQEEVKWNQPMFSHHGTYIIAFSVSKEHIAVTPETAAIRTFEKDIQKAGYSYSTMIFRIKWTDDVDFDLLRTLVAFNMEDKKDMTSFWRKA